MGTNQDFGTLLFEQHHNRLGYSKGFASTVGAYQQNGGQGQGEGTGDSQDGLPLFTVEPRNKEWQLVHYFEFGFDRKKLLKFEADGREFAKCLRSLEQFIQTVKGQNNFW